MRGFKPIPHAWDALLASLGPVAAEGAAAAAAAGGHQQHQGTAAAGGHQLQGELSSRPCGWMIDAIAHEEPQAERSLMHRFDTAQKLVERAGKAEDADEALAAVLVWLRRVEPSLPPPLPGATEAQPMRHKSMVFILGCVSLPCST